MPNMLKEGGGNGEAAGDGKDLGGGGVVDGVKLKGGILGGAFGIEKEDRSGGVCGRVVLVLEALGSSGVSDFDAWPDQKPKAALGEAG